jgi:hypothetical protein
LVDGTPRLGAADAAEAAGAVFPVSVDEVAVGGPAALEALEATSLGELGALDAGVARLAVRDSQAVSVVTRTITRAA